MKLFIIICFLLIFLYLGIVNEEFRAALYSMVCAVVVLAGMFAIMIPIVVIRFM